jgi:hypothetical protein
MAEKAAINHWNGNFQEHGFEIFVHCVGVQGCGND